MPSSRYTYTGSAITPEPVVKLEGRSLARGTDFTVAYSDNVAAGTATVTVTGRGNYGDSASATFAIVDSATAAHSGMWGTCPWELDSEGTLTIRPGTGTDTNKGTRPSWDAYKDDVKSVAFVSSGTSKVVLPEKTSFLFSEYANLRSVDISGADTSGTRSISRMFYKCTSLTDIDLAAWDTSAVTYMTGAFGYTAIGSSTLQSLDTSGAENLRALFEGCTGIDAFDLSSLDFSHARDIGEMFQGSSVRRLYASRQMTIGDTQDASRDVSPDRFCKQCGSLREADLSNVTLKAGSYNMWFDEVFSDCPSLASAVLPRMICAYPHLVETFSGCSSLTSVDMSRASGSVLVRGVFQGCSSLTSLNLSMFTVGSQASCMFEGCTRLSSLDVGGWDTSELGEAQCMFKNCTSLRTLDLSEWDVSSLTYVDEMFDGCPAPRPLWWSSVPHLRLASVELTDSFASDPDGTLRLRVQGTPADSPDPIAWTSSDERYVQVGQDGLVTIVSGTPAGGVVRVTAQAPNGVSDCGFVCPLAVGLDDEQIWGSSVTVELRSEDYVEECVLEMPKYSGDSMPKSMRSAQNAHYCLVPISSEWASRGTLWLRVSYTLSNGKVWYVKADGTLTSDASQWGDGVENSTWW